MGQPGYALLSRLGKYTHWDQLYNDNHSNKQVKYEYHWSIKFNIYFFFKYSVILFKNHWINYYKYLNINNNKYIKKKKYIYINSISWKYKINHFSLLIKSFYILYTFKKILVDSEIYVISLHNYICIYWFWTLVKNKFKFKNKKKNKNKFIKNISQFVYISASKINVH